MAVKFRVGQKLVRAIDSTAVILMRAMVDDRGFFDTRDEGYLDEDGCMFIGGRTDETIIRGAENIAPV
jgi:acyl-CoA synthetase (AMP-forming)/AMP-acid ligase II